MIGGIINAVAVFAIVCLFVVLVIILVNLFTKSYRPQYSVGVISALLAFFIFGTLMFLVSLHNFTDRLETELSLPNSNSTNSVVF